MRKYCSALGCNSKLQISKSKAIKNNIRFHRFPLKDPERVKAWKRICPPDFEPGLKTYLCSLHFDISSYANATRTQNLTKTAIPIIGKLERVKLISVGGIQTVDDFRVLCRTCSEREWLRPIKEVVGDYGNLTDLLKTYLDFDIVDGDQMPMNMCTTCIMTIVKFHDLKVKALKNDLCWRAILKEVAEKYCANTEIVKIKEEPDPLELNEKELTGEVKIGHSGEEHNKEAHSEIIVNDNEQYKEIQREGLGNGKEQIEEKESEKQETQLQIVFECSDCGKSFSSIFDLNSHTTKTHIETHCKVCLENFSSSSALKKHQEMTNHVLKKTYTCSVCLLNLETRTELLFHQKQMNHKPKSHNSTVECQICKKTIARKSLTTHLKLHSGEKPFVCYLCNSAFRLSRNLKRHLMIHTGERPHSCKICNKGFIQAVTLAAHMKTHTPKTNCRFEDNRYVCSECGRIFQRYVHYCVHMKAHKRENEEFTEVSSKKIERERNYFCPFANCNRSYLSSAALKAHTQTHGEKKFLCTECGRVFSTKGSLDSHQRTHTNEKPYKCLICDKSFSHSNSLQSHRATHKGVRQFVCKFCGKSFTQKPHLTQHLRVHTGEKPYGCLYCPKNFALRGNLVVHMRIHTGETPYVCEHCSKGFFDSSSLKKHYRKAHLVSPENYPDNVAEEVTLEA